ncbi:APC family permease [Actinomadura madurae]|uniref:APC family permease n=1 Tax=Actinomadura madurae TaxID=1993 RepID=UPI0020D20875|nr:amino acid permease [Actinomadura madurae]MCQ0004469.1 amino acid permease [Actinomadura madurae]
MTLDMRMRNNMFRRLPVEQATGRLYGGRHRLRVVYRTRDLVVLGLGVMIGSGIFKIAGEQASSTAGPGVLVSFLIAGGVCVLAALAFAELSSIVPVAGSAYSFSYVAFGEVWAWVVGWALIMELLLAASVLARVWSLYAAQALQDFGVGVPSWLGELIGQQKGPDLFALGILLLVVLMLATGSRMSLKSLWFMVMAKVIVIGLVIATALKFFSPGNLTPFLPPSQPAPEADQTVLDAVLGALGGGTPHVFGVWGMFAAAPAIAFAYIGFDLIATASEETDDAPRKVPRGILTALVTTIVLYAAVAVALVGMVGMDGIANLNPDKLLLAAAFDSVGAGAMGKIVDVGAMLALTTVILVLMISLTRVVFSISRDGLLPRPLAAMSRYKVPSRATLLAGGAAVVMSQTIDVLTLEQLVVIGSLFAFLFVAAAVLALRRSRPDLHRPFRMPAAPLVVIVTIFAIGWLMLNLNVETWAYFAIWMIVGIGIYLVYGRRKSQMKLLLDAPPPARPVAAPMAPAPPPGAALPRARRRRPRARCRGRGTCAPPPGRSARGRGRARGAPARRRAPTPPAGTRRDAGRAAGSRPSPTPPTRPRRAGHRAAARPGRTPPGRPRIRTRSIRACRTRTRPGPTSPGRTDPNPPGRTNPGPMNPGPRNPGRTSPGPTSPAPTSPAPTSRAARSRTPAARAVRSRVRSGRRAPGAAAGGRHRR